MYVRDRLYYSSCTPRLLRNIPVFAWRQRAARHKSIFPPNSPRHCRLLQFVALTRTQMISQGELIFEDTAPHVWYCNADSAKSCCCTCGKVTVCFTLARLSALRFASTHPLFGSCWRFRQALFSPVRFNPAAARFARRLAHRLLRITFSFAAQTHTCLHSRHTYSH